MKKRSNPFERAISAQGTAIDSMGRSVPGLIVVLVDLPRLQDVMERALLNKSHRARQGPIIVEFSNAGSAEQVEVFLKLFKPESIEIKGRSKL